MRSLILLFSLTLITAKVVANVNQLDISKISSDTKLVAAFDFIKENTNYYDHWSNEWNYDKAKVDLIQQLHGHYKSFSELTMKSGETFLLLGDIAHYLYNMDDTAYYKIAVNNYNEAQKNNPGDYRVYWFLAHHYALSNVPTSAIDNFIKAEKLLPTQIPADFWNDYAMATALANMPSHCIHAMNQAQSILGKKGNFEQELGESIYKRIIPVDKNQSYSKSDIWTVSENDKVAFTSRPLGVKVLVDSTWGISIYDYDKNQAAFFITPPAIANKKGRKIDYTVALLMKTVSDNDKLSDYLNTFVAKYPDKKQLNFSDKYDKMIAYEIKDKTMYPEIGGGHMYIIGIERNAPKYAGLLLESPVVLPKGNAGEFTYYTASGSKDRFNGKIFYALILDSCEDINEQSLKVFKSLFDHQIIIE